MKKGARPMEDLRREVAVYDLGTTSYEEVHRLQQRLQMQRREGSGQDTLLLTEHRPVFTLGRSHPEPDLRVAADTVHQYGIEIVQTERGGDITYHGPGQIVGYPILKLSRYGGDVLRYLRMLEETIIAALAGYGIAGERIAGLTGVWVGGAKICAIGVKLSASGVTQHGFALNVNTDLRFFEQIIPCGIADRGVTSLERVLGAAPPRAEVEARVIAAFGRVFGAQIE